MKLGIGSGSTIVYGVQRLGKVYNINVTEVLWMHVVRLAIF